MAEPRKPEAAFGAPAKSTQNEADFNQLANTRGPRPVPMQRTSESNFSGGIDLPELDHVMSRIVNQKGAAEGTTLPPRQQGELRVPIVSGLKVAKLENYFGGTQVTLVWDQPEIIQQQVSHFNIYVTGLLSNNTEPQGPTTVQKSPAQVRLQTKDECIVVFTVQTVLKSGLMSLLGVSSSVSARIAAGSFTSADFLPGTIPVNALANGTPGDLISWDSAGVVTLAPAGIADTILVSAGAAAPVYKSRTTLDLVEGRSNLTTAGRVVLVSAAGVVTESASTLADVVTGASNLTTPGAVPFVLSSGVLTDDPTKLFYDDTNDRLGIGNAAPAATVHVTQATPGTEVQRLETTTTNDDVAERVFQNRVATTNATITTIQTVAIPASTTVALDAVVIARRTGGAAGTAEDGARYHIQGVFKNVAGTATLIGALNVVEDEDQAGWDATFNVSAGNVLIQVTGAVNNNVTWHMTLRYYGVSS